MPHLDGVGTMTKSATLFYRSCLGEKPMWFLRRERRRFGYFKFGPYFLAMHWKRKWVRNGLQRRSCRCGSVLADWPFLANGEFNGARFSPLWRFSSGQLPVNCRLKIWRLIGFISSAWPLDKKVLDAVTFVLLGPALGEAIVTSELSDGGLQCCLLDSRLKAVASESYLLMWLLNCWKDEVCSKADFQFDLEDALNQPSKANAEGSFWARKTLLSISPLKR